MIAKHIDRFPLLKLDQVIDWQPTEQYLNRQRTRYLRDHRGRPAYPLLSMFKAVLLGQWHSLSDGQKTAAQKSGSQTRKHHSTIPSQRERILAVLQSGRSLTAYEMHQMGIMGCNARIMELRRAGYQIACIMEQVKNQYGQTVQRGRYSLVSEGRA